MIADLLLVDRLARAITAIRDGDTTTASHIITAINRNDTEAHIAILHLAHRVSRTLAAEVDADTTQPGRWVAAVTNPGHVDLEPAEQFAAVIAARLNNDLAGAAALIEPLDRAERAALLAHATVLTAST